MLRDALISTEDKDFFAHSGINVWRIAGAAYRDIESGGRVQGASTLTMQLARNLFLSPDRSFHRKIQESLLAIQIERRFTKQQIFHAVREPDFSWAGRVRLRVGLGVLLQQARKEDDAR